MAETELAECGCGGDGLLINPVNDPEHPNHTMYSVNCIYCGMRTGWHYSNDSAEAEWNKAFNLKKPLKG